MSVKLRKIDESRWEIPQEGAMRVPGIIFSNEKMMTKLRHDKSLEQVKNVATLPGIVKASYAMPDIHWGYGFPIGGVAAFDADNGIVTPGGIGFDINCGVRMLRSDLEHKNIKHKKLKTLVDKLFDAVPSGVGSRRRDLKLTTKQLRKVMTQGAQWALENGYATPDDIAHMEERGKIKGADPDAVTDRAIQRGSDQLGTLGSGNHFCEVDVVERIDNKEIAEAFGIFEGQVVVLIHTGSRGFGYQVCDDYLAKLNRVKHDFKLPDRQLACAQLGSPLANEYLAAMRAAVNFAFCNRQVIAHNVRETFRDVFGGGASNHNMSLIYDVAHNIAKEETHTVDGKKRRVLVHRKGAIRAFGPGHESVPEKYREHGQPVFIPGDMGRYSYILAGTEGAMNETFGTACHGAGRVMSRSKAKKRAQGGRQLAKQLEADGVLARSASWKTLAEEMPYAYKDVNDVVSIVVEAGLAKSVARLRPLAVVKG